MVQPELSNQHCKCGAAVPATWVVTARAFRALRDRILLRQVGRLGELRRVGRVLLLLVVLLRIIILIIIEPRNLILAPQLMSPRNKSALCFLWCRNVSFTLCIVSKKCLIRSTEYSVCNALLAPEDIHCGR